MSAWITPLQALGAARTAPPRQDPPPAPYLVADEPWLLDVNLEIERNGAVVARPRADLYWTPAQMLAHLTVNGARLSAGDLLTTGTISGGPRGWLRDHGRGTAPGRVRGVQATLHAENGAASEPTWWSAAVVGGWRSATAGRS